MNRTRRFRLITALAAAYVIGLQALLLSVAIGSMSAGTLCLAGGSAGGSPAPAGGDTGCPCAAGCGMQCGVHALAGPPQSLLVLASWGAATGLALPAIEPVQQPTLRSPERARAPPAA